MHLQAYSYVSSATVSGQNGYNFRICVQLAVWTHLQAYFPTCGRIEWRPSTVAMDGFSGNHCFEFVIGTSSSVNDRMFSDCGEMTYYAQGSGYALLGGVTADECGHACARG